MGVPNISSRPPLAVKSRHSAARSAARLSWKSAARATSPPIECAIRCSATPKARALGSRVSRSSANKASPASVTGLRQSKAKLTTW